MELLLGGGMPSQEPVADTRISPVASSSLRASTLGRLLDVIKVPNSDQDVIASVCNRLVTYASYRAAADELPGIVEELEMWQNVLWHAARPASAAQCTSSKQTQPSSRPHTGHKLHGALHRTASAPSGSHGATASTDASPGAATAAAAAYNKLPPLHHPGTAHRSGSSGGGSAVACSHSHSNADVQYPPSSLDQSCNSSSSTPLQRQGGNLTTVYASTPARHANRTTSAAKPGAVYYQPYPSHAPQPHHSHPPAPQTSSHSNAHIPAPLYLYQQQCGRKWKAAPLLSSQQEWSRLRPATGKTSSQAAVSGSPAASPAQHTGMSVAGGRQPTTAGQFTFNATMTKRLRELQKDQMETVQSEARPKDVRLTGRTVLAAVLAAGALQASDTVDLESD